LCSIGARSVMDDLIPAFERATGYRVDIVDVTATSLQDRLKAGANADLIIQSTDIVERLMRERIVAGEPVAFARAGIGAAVRAGAPKPAICTADAFRRAMLAAQSVAYSRGASGIYVATLMQQLGIADQMQSKTRVIDGVPVAVAIARGEAEIGLQQINVIKPVAGVDYVGPLPPELQHFVVFYAVPLAAARDLAAAEALSAFMSAPAAAPLIQRSMELVSR
jgi:molybdate transport system substrate-binding protein